MTDLYSSPFRSFGASFDINNNNLSGKRRRFFEDETNTENNFSSQPEECYQPEKRFRSKAFVTPQFQSDDRFVEMEKNLNRLENEVHFLKENLERKDAEMNELATEHQTLQSEHETLSSATSRLNDENRILKKAVGIQENKQKELHQQIQHMQEVMNQAADYIAGLERTNARLQQQIQSNNCPETFLPNLPPDVY